MKNAKRLSVILVVALVVCVALTTVLAACNKKDSYDPEERPLSMSIQTPDGVFNPFFSTSAYDSSVISLTQIGMLNTDKQGNIVAGLDQPTVALAFKETEQKNPAKPDETLYTDYEFLLKNGIKFSDGQDLTIKDVLFNLYVNLDPAFTGSATMYSTDIEGMRSYRTQIKNANESQSSGFDDQFIATASSNLKQLTTYAKWFGKGSKKNLTWSGATPYDAAANQTYIDKINYLASLFKNELVSDWNAINMTDYEKWGDVDSGKFTEPWQVFLLNDGGDTTILKRKDDNPSGPFAKNNDGNYILDEAAAISSLRECLKGYDANVTLEDVNAMSTEARMEYIKNACVESVFESAFPVYTVTITKNDKTTATLDNKLPVTADGAVEEKYSVDIPELSGSKVEEVATAWASASTLFDYLTAEAKTDYFEKYGEELTVPTITGITAMTVNSFTGKQTNADNAPDVTINGQHVVLKIRVNKVDPKAIYNFSFTVAPMHYYSNEEQIDLVTGDWNKLGSTFTEQQFTENIKHFGVKYGDISFMNDVLNAASKVGVPIGAGSYKATNSSDGDNPTGTGANGFFNANMVYYMRNDYFWTVGADGGSQESSKLQNAIIKHVRYKVVDADKVINSVGKDIDYGDPSATTKNIDTLKQNGDLELVLQDTLGYGYIGINPRYIPEIQVRRAIMKAMDIDLMINNYYDGELASRVYRPMSKLSWAYPTDATVYAWGTGSAENLEFDGTGKEIRALVESAGYKPGSDGIYAKGTRKLDIKFTIAGGSTDHPAYATFLAAQSLLNDNGFKISVVTSQTALSDLSAGKLAVWAAAWSSTIDPDMYQVYHKDSQASSTSNWGYKQIKADTKTYKEEWRIINELSDEIDLARQTTDRQERTDAYAICLDLVMELAVELPTYQRKDLSVYNKKVINSASLPKHNTGDADEVSPYYGLFSRIWEVSYN